MTPVERRDAPSAEGPAETSGSIAGAGPGSTPGVAPAALAALAAVLAATSCGDRPGPAWTSSDVAGPPPARETTCVAPGRAEAAPRTHVVRAGESLRSIAAREYGDERLWTEIARANPSAVARGDVLRLGAVLVLPADIR